MPKLGTISICYTDLKNALNANQNHSSITKHTNGKIYLDCVIWEKDEPDQYNNDLSMQLNSKNDNQATEAKIYLGNGRKYKSQAPTSNHAYSTPHAAKNQYTMPPETNKTPENLTKREYFAGLAMQGILANEKLTNNLNGTSGMPIPSFLAEYSLMYADALIVELSRKY